MKMQQERHHHHPDVVVAASAAETTTTMRDDASSRETDGHTPECHVAMAPWWTDPAGRDRLAFIIVID